MYEPSEQALDTPTLPTVALQLQLNIRAKQTHPLSATQLRNVWYTSLKKCISQECQGASIRVTNTTQYYQYKFQQISCLYMIGEKT